MNKTKFCKIKYERAVRGVASTGGDTFGMSLTQYPCIEGCTGPAKVEVPNTGLKNIYWVK